MMLVGFQEGRFRVLGIISSKVKDERLSGVEGTCSPADL